MNRQMDDLTKAVVPHFMCSDTNRFSFCLRAGLTMQQLSGVDLSGSPSGADCDLYRFFKSHGENIEKFIEFCLATEPPEGISRM